MRREFPARIKAAAFERCKGICEQCTRRLFPGDIHYDHRTPDGSGGEPTFDNCNVLCKSCHAVKTAQRDIPDIAKGKRVHRAHIGARKARPSFATNRDQPFKKKITGEVVRR